jgi:hypothetical protein
MAGTTELYRGMIIEYNNEPHILVEKEFKAMGWEQKTHGFLYLFVVHHAALLIEEYEKR